MMASEATATEPSTLGDGPAIDHATSCSAPTVIRTASTNRTTSRRLSRRAAAWSSKKFIGEGYGAVSGTLAEPHPWDLAHFRPVRRDRQHGGRVEAEVARDQAGREHLALVVVGHDRVVVRLARKGKAVLGAGQLFGELGHGLVGFQLRVGLADHHQATQGTLQ